MAQLSNVARQTSGTVVRVSGVGGSSNMSVAELMRMIETQVDLLKQEQKTVLQSTAEATASRGMQRDAAWRALATTLHDGGGAAYGWKQVRCRHRN